MQYNVYIYIYAYTFICVYKANYFAILSYFKIIKIKIIVIIIYKYNKNEIKHQQNCSN